MRFGRELVAAGLASAAAGFGANTLANDIFDAEAHNTAVKNCARVMVQHETKRPERCDQFPFANREHFDINNEVDLHDQTTSTVDNHTKVYDMPNPLTWERRHLNPTSTIESDNDKQLGMTIGGILLGAIGGFEVSRRVFKWRDRRANQRRNNQRTVVTQAPHHR